MLCRYSLQVIKRKLLICRSYSTCETEERVSCKQTLVHKITNVPVLFQMELSLNGKMPASKPPLRTEPYKINSYYRLPVFQRVTPKSLFCKGGDFLPVFCRYYKVPICTAMQVSFAAAFLSSWNDSSTLSVCGLKTTQVRKFMLFVLTTI